MSILDELDRVRQGATQKTKNISDTIRLSNLVKDEERLQNIYLKEIGDYIYSHKEIVEELAIKKIVVKIDESKDKINQYRKQINCIKNVVVCKNCNHEMPAEMMYCTQCGSKIEKENYGFEQVMLCNNCGTEIKEGQVFCINCGMKVNGINQFNDAVVKKCVQCGADISSDNTFCANCGVKLT